MGKPFRFMWPNRASTGPPGDRNAAVLWRTIATYAVAIEPSGRAAAEQCFAAVASLGAACCCRAACCEAPPQPASAATTQNPHRIFLMSLQHLTCNPGCASYTSVEVR